MRDLVQPIKDEITNYERQSLIDLAGASTALENGYTGYYSNWENDSNIIIMLKVHNNEIMLAITYRDINYEEDVNDSGL